MWVTALQITIAFALPACVVWAAVRSARRRGTRPPSPGDDTYYLVDFGSHGVAGHHSGADFSGPSGESASGGDGGGDGGGGGSSSD